MSKGSYLTDNGGHNGPHPMFYETAEDDAAWLALLFVVYEVLTSICRPRGEVV